MPNSKNRLDYLSTIYASYMSHINSIFNFSLVFSGLVLSAIALVVGNGMSECTLFDEFLAGFGLLIGLVFLALDRRARQIIEFLENSMKAEEEAEFPGKSTYLAGLPKNLGELPKKPPEFIDRMFSFLFLSKYIRHTFLFPFLYIMFWLLFIVLIFAL